MSGLRALPYALAAALAIGCGGSGGGGGGAPDPSKTPATSRPPPTTGPASAGPLGEDDCRRLLDHVLEVELADLRARLPPEEVPTTAQVTKIRAAMDEGGMKGCVGEPRPPFVCAMATSSADALRACLTPAAAPTPSAP